MPTPDCCNHARIIVCKNILENNISKKFSIGSLNIVYKGVQGSKGPGGPRTCCMLPIHQKTYHDHKTPKPFRERKNSKKKPRRYLTRDRSLSNETCAMFNVFWMHSSARWIAITEIASIEAFSCVAAMQRRADRRDGFLLHDDRPRHTNDSSGSPWAPKIMNHHGSVPS